MTSSKKAIHLNKNVYGEKNYNTKNITACSTKHNSDMCVYKHLTRNRHI